MAEEAEDPTTDESTDAPESTTEPNAQARKRHPTALADGWLVSNLHQWLSGQYFPGTCRWCRSTLRLFAIPVAFDQKLTGIGPPYYWRCPQCDPH